MAYSKKTWSNDEVITQDAMNNIENGIAALDAKAVNAVAGSKDGFISKEDKSKLDGITPQANKYVLPTANKTTIGGVKQMALIQDLSTETTNDLKDKINAILAELKKQGIMANS